MVDDDRVVSVVTVVVPRSIPTAQWAPAEQAVKYSPGNPCRRIEAVWHPIPAKADIPAPSTIVSGYPRPLVMPNP